ncbi:hypothetical protein ACVWYG_000421 [Pedobacter sp. UYEF25]
MVTNNNRNSIDLDNSSPDEEFSTNKKVIGNRVTINYFDQNYNFETIFPKKGIITETIKVESQKMFVLELDNHFEYKNLDYKIIVLTERHAGHHIGDNNEVHVHVLLPKTELNKDTYKIADFDHVVWATLTPTN